MNLPIVPHPCWRVGAVKTPDTHVLVTAAEGDRGNEPHCSSSSSSCIAGLTFPWNGSEPSCAVSTPRWPSGSQASADTYRTLWRRTHVGSTPAGMPWSSSTGTTGRAWTLRGRHPRVSGRPSTSPTSWICHEARGRSSRRRFDGEGRSRVRSCVPRHGTVGPTLPTRAILAIVWPDWRSRSSWRPARLTSYVLCVPTSALGFETLSNGIYVRADEGQPKPNQTPSRSGAPSVPPEGGRG